MGPARINKKATDGRLRGSAGPEFIEGSAAKVPLIVLVLVLESLKIEYEYEYEYRCAEHRFAEHEQELCKFAPRFRRPTA